MVERGTGICRGLSLWCKLIYRLRTLMAAEVAQIRSYEPGYGRNDSTLVSKLPEPIDIKNDIFKPDKTNKFSIAMTSALRTRNLLDHLQQRELSMRDIQQQYPTADAASVMATYEVYTEKRQKGLAIAMGPGRDRTCPRALCAYTLPL